MQIFTTFFLLARQLFYFHGSSPSLPSPSCSSSWWLPFGRDVLLLLGEGSEAVVSQEGPAVTADEALDALTPPAGVSVAAALEHQRPAKEGAGTLA